MPFECLNLFNRNHRYRGRTGSLPLLNIGCEIVIGLSLAYPVIKLGKYLIKAAGRELRHVPIFRAAIVAGPLVMHGRDVFYPIQLSDFAPDLDEMTLILVDTGNNRSVSRGSNTATLEQICFSQSAKFHRCDRPPDGPATDLPCAWFLLNHYILLKRDLDNEESWQRYGIHPDSASEKYFLRRVDIVSRIIGSTVKITDKNLIKKMKFKNKPGKVVCTIPGLTAKEKILKAVVVEFDEDIGGYSMDGKYKKGSCLVVPLEKIEKVEGG